ncbi:MAG: alpha/beta hydrolase [Alteraurantiacibacter sp.]|nr:alpha/beta hydrolase [Alteraurantiacibacter sp.]
MRRVTLAIALAFACASLALAIQPSASLAQSRRAVSDMQTLAYGEHRLQRLDYWPAASRNAPLVVFVHGGGWKRGDKRMMHGSAKLSHWQASGYAVASLNYRLVPEVTVEQQATDVASAIAFLRNSAGDLGFDARRIALVGHSAGAHLVALVGTDPHYFRTAGLAMNDVAGIVPLDGAGYNVPDQMDENARLMGDTYRQAFGTDPARQRALSPTFHAAAPNAPEFLILHVQREDARRQSEELAADLRRAGTPASVQGFAGRGLRGHAEINRRLGEPDYLATPVVDAFLVRIFAR